MDHNHPPDESIIDFSEERDLDIFGNPFSERTVSSEEREEQERLLAIVALSGISDEVNEEALSTQEEEDETSSEEEAMSGLSGTKTVTLDGVQIQVNVAPVPSSSVKRILHTKKERYKFSAEKREEIMTKARSSTSLKYRELKPELLALAKKESVDLEEAYNITRINQQVQRHHEMYDLHDVMKIVFYDEKDPYNITKTVNLYDEFVNVTSQQVAASNKWYMTIPDASVCPWFRDNLTYLFDQLCSNCEPSFLVNCLDQYDGFDESEQGGPLLYWIIQQKLMNSSRTAVERLIQSVKGLNISEIEGENIETAVAQIRGAYRRLKLIKDPVTGVCSLPTDFDKIVTKIFRTTTITAFNDVFNVEAEEWRAKLAGEKFAYPTVEAMLNTAQELYYELSAQNNWLVLEKGASAFPTTDSKVPNAEFKCWNCGGTGHRLDNCPHPKNEARIKAARDSHKQAQARDRPSSGRGRGNGGRGGRGGRRGRGGRGGRSGRGRRGKSPSPKWAPPTAQELQNGSRRMIDGKPHVWNNERKFWVGEVNANVANSGEAAPSNSSEQRHVRFAQPPEAATQYHHSFRNMLGSYAES